MQEPTKKRPTDDGLVTIRLRVHPKNAEKIKEFARIIENSEEQNYTIAEVFPEYIGKEQQISIRAYRYREDITQRQLSTMTGIPQRHISEMENGKRVIGKEMAKRLGKALKADYKAFL
jgi:ribosome-binding protein aMBF1 (putative translation factor)